MPKPELPQGAIPCLDKGFLRLVEHMGDDAAIVQAARVSYGKGTRQVTRDRGLIRYLMRHRHTTPFEMVEFKFHAKMPIFVARQWVRHRTANINEYSLRYSEARDEFYIPEPGDIHFQSTTNRQGREQGEVPQDLKKRLREGFRSVSRQAFELYSELNAAGVARELARAVLPLNLYTEWYWKNDLHNIFHFLSLRGDLKAQYEIRVYAEAMAAIVKEITPIAYEAFQDYIVQGIRISSLERSLLSKKLPRRVRADLHEDLVLRIVASLASAQSRNGEELYGLYCSEGGTDSRENFEVKWAACDEIPGNVRELREFRDKLRMMF